MKTMLENRYTPEGYRKALWLMETTEFESDEWKTARQNLFEIVETGIRQDDKEMARWFAHTVVDELDSLIELNDDNPNEELEEAIAYDKALLTENGFGYLLDDLFD